MNHNQAEDVYSYQGSLYILKGRVCGDRKGGGGRTGSLKNRGFQSCRGFHSKIMSYTMVLEKIVHPHPTYPPYSKMYRWNLEVSWNQSYVKIKTEENHKEMVE